MAKSSSSKHRGSKIGRVGGLGGPGGRSSRSTARQRGIQPVHDVARGSARDLADEAERAVGRGVGGATAYRAAMTALSAYANEHSRTMLPETRRKLAEAKDLIREDFGMTPEAKGAGGPGAKRTKPKVKSRRTSYAESHRRTDRSPGHANPHPARRK